MDYEKPKINNKRMPVTFNIAQNHAYFIHNLIQQSTKAFLSGDIGKWYWHLKAVRLNINHLLTEEEEKPLDEAEKDCNRKSGAWNKYRIAKDQGLDEKARTYLNSKNDFAIEVEQYKKQIMKMLNAQGYFPRKDDQSILKF